MYKFHKKGNNLTKEKDLKGMIFMSRKNYRKSNNFKKLMIASLITLVIAIIAFIVAYTSYSNKVKQNLENSLLKADDLADMIANENSNLVEEANSQIGKTIEESAKDLETPTPIATDTPTPIPATPTVVEEPVPEFIMPVEGEIMREYAKENLIYSQTLDEWVTHLGIDIKADKTSVVKAASAGTVTAIKNDPRYGLTVVVEHTKGFKTVYSNLLTAEYVTIGQTVTSGQTLGTVGNTATFEILDEYHLHFEILENDENVDPNLYINK